MTKKLFSFVFIVAFAMGFMTLFTAKTTYAADQVFPAGCSSAVGYSASTGRPCNGTNTATTLPAGCTNVIGYSSTTGHPCSGTSIAIGHVAGCTSFFGYSATTGQACNGGTYAIFPTPGFPNAGSGDVATNIALLLSSGILAVIGSMYLYRRFATK